MTQKIYAKYRYCQWKFLVYVNQDVSILVENNEKIRVKRYNATEVHEKILNDSI